MTFWLINLETDVMLGFIPYSQKLSIITITLFWLINILIFSVQDTYLINNIFCFETLAAVLSIYLVIGLSQYYLILKRRVDAIIVPEGQFSPQKTPQMGVESLQRTLIPQISSRKQPEEIEQAEQEIQPDLIVKFEKQEQPQLTKQDSNQQITPKIQKKQIKWLLMFLTIFILHTLLFIHQMTSQIVLESAISMHIILLTELFSSVLVNFFVIISIGNLIINLYQKDVFLNYYKNDLFQKTFINYCANITEIYIFSFNISLIMSSIVGILFLNDLASQIIFYFYLAIFGIVFLYKLYRKIKTNEY